MQTTDVARRTIPIAFSRDFESKLLNFCDAARSLSADLEAATRRGLEMLEELEDVHDLKHTETVQLLIALTNKYLQMDGQYFQSWHIAVAEDILDEIDLVKITHGEDLIKLGLEKIDQGSLVVLVATAGLVLQEPLKQQR